MRVHMASRIRSAAAVALLIAMVLPALVLVHPYAEAAESEAKLYLYRNPRQMATESPSLDQAAQTMTVGTVIEYPIPFPLTRDMEVWGQNGDDLLLHLEQTKVNPSWTGLILYVEVIDQQNETVTQTIASREFKQSELTQFDFKVPLAENGAVVQQRHSLILRLSLTEGTSPTGLTPPFGFAYTWNGAYSYLALKSNHVSTEDISVNALMNGQIVTEVLPNAPEDARTVMLSAGVADSFGAYDISSININITGSDGGVILDITGTWDDQTNTLEGDQGDPRAYFNTTYTVPENLPEGEYTLTATATSNTGQAVTGSSILRVASGLFFALTDASKKVVTAGDVVEFEAKVINGGSGDDRVAFSSSSGRDWPVQAPMDLELAGGAEDLVMFRVTVPVEAPVKQTDIIKMKASSRNADKDYEIVGEIEVGKAATFAITPEGESSQAVFLGDRAGYTLSVRNLENVTRTYELSIEDAPDGLEYTYYGQGVTSGSVYSSVSVGPRSLVEVFLNVTVDTGADDGSYELKAFGRIKGDTEKKFVYLTLLVVDGEKDALAARGGIVEKTTTRAGNDYPVGYKAVTFTLDVYNPTLSEATIAIDASGPSGWTISGNYEEIDLFPGSSSAYNVSITPAKGEPYSADGKIVKVTSSGSGIEDGSINLEVKVPLIIDIKLDIEVSGPINGEAGAVALANITVKNGGNREEKVNISAESKDGLVVDIEPGLLTLAPGDEDQAAISVDLPKKTDDANYAITLKATAGGKTTTLPLDVFAKGVEDGTGFQTWMIIVIVVVIVVLGLVGAFLYMRMGKKEQPAPTPTVAPARKEFRMAPRPAPRPYVPPRPIAPPPDEEMIRRADQLSRDMLETKRVVEVTEMD
jgi:uncharacterized membrane protein